MKLALRKSIDNVWAFKETFDTKFSYNGVGTIKAVLGIQLNQDGSFEAIPYRHLDAGFEPVSSVLSRFTIEEWLKAKKPIYSILGSGLIVRFIIKYNEGDGSIIVEKSTFEVYQPIISRMTDTEMPLARVFQLPLFVENGLRKVMVELFSGVNPSRASFLSRRFR